MKVSTINKKYFTKDDGTPLFFASSYDHSPLALGAGFWIPWLNDMSKGGNYARIACMAQTGSYKMHTYQQVGDKFNLTVFNPAWFKQLRAFIVAAKAAGIYVHLSLFNEIFIKKKTGCGFARHYFGNGNHINKDLIDDVDRNHDGDGTDSNEFYDVAALKGHAVDSQRSNVAKLQKKYVDKIIKIAGDYDNVFFEVGNEVLAKDWVQYWVEYIKSKSSIPVTVPSESYNEDQPGVDGVAYHRIQYAHGTNYNILVGLDSDGDADSYDQADPEVNRKGAWKTFTTGHSILGNYAETIIRKPVGDGFVYSNDPRLSKQFTYFGYLQKFITESKFKFELAKYNTQVSSSLYCMADVGKQYVVYLEIDHACTVNLIDYAYKFRVRWFNSKTGEFSVSTKINGGRMQSFVAPSGFDVLFLDKK